MKIHTFIFAIATAGLATQALAGAPVVTTDRFKGTTKVESELEPLTSHNTGDKDTLWNERIDLVAVIKDGSLLGPLSINFMYGRNQWKYLNCHDINFLVDGAPFEIASTFERTMAQHGVVIEIVEVHPTREQLDKLAAAKKVEYRICTDEGSLTDSALQAIRSFGPVLDRTLAGNPDPTAPPQPQPPAAGGQ